MCSAICLDLLLQSLGTLGHLWRFPCYHGAINRQQAVSRLAPNGGSSPPVDGTYLLRESSKGPGFLALDVVVDSGRHLPLLIEVKAVSPAMPLRVMLRRNCLSIGHDGGYASLEEMFKRNRAYFLDPLPRPP